MSRLYEKEEICSCCKNKSTHKMISSSTAFGGCDLDFRVPPLDRFTQNLLVKECPYCGYVNYSLEHRIEGAKECINSANYKKINEMADLNSDAKKFIKFALLYKNAGNYEEELKGYIYASWMCDDAKEKESAIAIRSRAADLMLSKYRDGELCRNEILQLSDFLRRSRRFDDVIKLLTEYKCDDGSLVSAALAFELAAAERKDDERYKFTEEQRIKKNPIYYD